MTDYLLIHGAGQGAWSWGRVWGYMTAPVEHPPRLYTRQRAERVFPLDLPGHGGDADGDTGAVTLEECVHSITRAVERQGLKDLILVGHGFAGPLILRAAQQLDESPKRLVLVAGIVPENGRDMLTAFPRNVRHIYKVLSLMSKLSGRDLKVPKPAIDRCLCNGMDPMEIVQAVGFFGPLPTRVLSSKVSLGSLEVPYPVSYVVLSEDKLLPPDVQRQMAARIPNAEVLELESCHQAMLYKPRELADMLLGLA